MAMAPTYWKSSLGTRINTGALQGPQLQRVQTLANSGYGTRAQRVADTLNARIPRAPLSPIAPRPMPPTPGGTNPKDPNIIHISPIEGGGVPLNPNNNLHTLPFEGGSGATGIQQQIGSSGGIISNEQAAAIRAAHPELYQGTASDPNWQPKAPLSDAPNAWIPENKTVTSSTPAGTPPTGGGLPVNQTQKIPVTGGGAKAGTPWQVPTDLPTLQAQRDHIMAGIAKRKAQGISSPNDTMRLQQINKAIAGLGNQGQLPDDNGAVTPTPPAPTGTTTDGSGTTTTTDPNITNTLFPTAQLFEKGYAGDPLYDWQVQQGLDQVDKSLAARGLSNSGAGIKAELQVPQQAAALATDRMQQLATDNANRLYNIQQNEANKLYNQGNDQWSHALSLAQLMADQSPWNAALAGLNNTATLTKEQGQALANYLAQAYRRASGGGGGGASFTPVPLPTGPDYSNITPTSIAGNASSNNGWLNVLTNSLSSLFGGK